MKIYEYLVNPNIERVQVKELTIINLDFFSKERNTYHIHMPDLPNIKQINYKDGTKVVNLDRIPDIVTGCKHL